MRVLVAPDKFKGTLSAAEAADAIARGLRAAGADVDVVPIADGGEGTLDALVAALGGSVMGVIARGPMGVPVRAHLGRLTEGTIIVELAQASGIGLVPEGQRDPMRATTYGTGELIKGALALRPQRIIVAIGGSASAPLMSS
ncbi:MAG TPA: glycerate kinase, partial [Actinomycetota bacterium]|nr:glycerate kinase [Actinomycetota bacterium]